MNSVVGHRVVNFWKSLPMLRVRQRQVAPLNSVMPACLFSPLLNPLLQDHLDRIRSAEGKDYFDHSKIEAETGTVTTMAKQASIDAGNPSSSNGSSDKRAGPPDATSLHNTRSTSGGSTPAKAAGDE